MVIIMQRVKCGDRYSQDIMENKGKSFTLTEGVEGGLARLPKGDNKWTCTWGMSRCHRGKREKQDIIPARAKSRHCLEACVQVRDEGSKSKGVFPLL